MEGIFDDWSRRRGMPSMLLLWLETAESISRAAGVEEPKWSLTEASKGLRDETRNMEIIECRRLSTKIPKLGRIAK